MYDKLLVELSAPGRRAVSLPPLDVPEAEPLPEEYLRSELPLPEVAEIDLVRHYVRLSQKNFAIDTTFYPLGSCTMKYNPKVNEEAARFPGFVQIHPLQPEETVQGALELMWELQNYLAEITGMDAATLQPAAGAHGELTGILMIRAYLRDRGEYGRDEVLVPDSAHGTNPATAAMAGFKVVPIPSDRNGDLDLEALRRAVSDRTAALMFTLPTTLGLFDPHVLEITETVHRAGGLVYGDGANLNAVLGRVKHGDLGFDVLHINLHKTFSTPHGAGGPGSGPVTVKAHLAPYLPAPVVVREETENGPVYRLARPEKSIGRVRSFHGSFNVLVRAYAYIRSLGAEGLKEVADNAVLNANYLLARLKEAYHLPYDRRCMHEFVLSGVRQERLGVKTLDIAKRLIDYGFHPPTIYFPLIVKEALMIEPTETESRETLDAFAEAMLAIAREAETEPQVVKSAPHHTPVRRLDEARAARQPVLRWRRAEAAGQA
jgi:glycine dehydrogenase subunit 2